MNSYNAINSSNGIQVRKKDFEMKQLQANTKSITPLCINNDHLIFLDDLLAAISFYALVAFTFFI